MRFRRGRRRFRGRRVFRGRRRRAFRRGIRIGMRM